MSMANSFEARQGRNLRNSKKKFTINRILTPRALCRNTHAVHADSRKRVPSLVVTSKKKIFRLRNTWRIYVSELCATVALRIPVISVSGKFVAAGLCTATQTWPNKAGRHLKIGHPLVLSDLVPAVLTLFCQKRLAKLAQDTVFPPTAF